MSSVLVYGSSSALGLMASKGPRKAADSWQVKAHARQRTWPLPFPHSLHVLRSRLIADEINPSGFGPGNGVSLKSPALQSLRVRFKNEMLCDLVIETFLLSD